MTRLRALTPRLVLFALVALPFAVRPRLIGGDEPHYALMAHSLAVDLDIDLEADYLRVEHGAKEAGASFSGKRLDRHLREYRGRRVFAHPLGLPVLAAPGVAALAAVSPSAAPDLLFGLLGVTVTFLALCAGVALLGETIGVADGMFVALAFFFATPLWYYGRTFFTEPYQWSFGVLAVWLFSKRRWLSGSALLAGVFLFKETSALWVAPILVAVLFQRGWRAAARAAVFPALALALWAMKNRAVYGDFLVTFHAFDFGNPIVGAAGLLFDPRHGLLPFAPLALLALPGLRNPGERWSGPVQWGLFGFLGLFLLTSAWAGWRGGSCYGPRLLLPALPALALPLALAWSARKAAPGFRRLFFVLFAAGFTIEWCAITHPFRAFWEISVAELLLGRPWTTASGVLIALFFVFAAQRFLLRVPRRS